MSGRVPDHDRETLFELSTAMRYMPNEVVCRRGDNDRKLFVVTEGELHVMRNDAAGQPVHLATLKPGEFFGELNFIFGHERAATVIAGSEATVQVLDHSRVAQIKRQMPELYNHLENLGIQRWSTSILTTHPLLQPLSEQERTTFIAQTRVVTMVPGSTLLDRHQQPDTIWLLLSGNIDLVDRSGHDIEIRDGGCLLPAGILKNQPCDWRATAITESICTATPLSLVQKMAEKNADFAQVLQEASF